MTREAIFDKVMLQHHLRSKEEHESAGLVCLIIAKIGSRLVPPPGPDDTVEAILQRALQVGNKQAQALCASNKPTVAQLRRLLQEQG